jgi:hypothetical protein
MEPSGRNRWQPVANETPQKDRSNQPIRLSREGYSKPEIGAQLFLSSRTLSGTCARYSQNLPSAPAKSSTQLYG